MRKTKVVKTIETFSWEDGEWLMDQRVHTVEVAEVEETDESSDGRDRPPVECPMDTDPQLTRCPHDDCWLIGGCQAANPVTP